MPTQPDRPDAEFKLSITQALAHQLHEALGKLRPAPLHSGQIDELQQERPGVYALYVRSERVYIGKASKSLNKRLMKHHRKLSGRTGFDGMVQFVCLYVDEDLEASAPEKMLIKAFKDEGGAAWNNNGFGNNDPGVKRDASLVKQNHFDALHPIDLNYAIKLPEPSKRMGHVYEALTNLKKALPFNLRFDRARDKELRGAAFVTPPDKLPLRTWMSLVIGALPEGWQATALPGYVVVYEKGPADYPSATTYWRQMDGRVRELPGLGKQDGPGDIENDFELPTQDEEDGLVPSDIQDPA